MTTFFDAFISYGRTDSLAFGRKLHARLLEERFNVWFDQNDIPLGVDFQNQIDDGIEKAHNFLFIIAPHSINSSYCLKEIELAIKRNKRIIPLLHVEQISQETWQQRNLNGTPEDWEAYKAQGKHTVFQNMHPTISKINWVYFREGIDDFEKSCTGLIDLFRRHADYVEQHTQFLVKALEWERHQKSHSFLLIGDEKQQAQAWLKQRFKDEQPPCVPSDLHCEYITESIKNANNLMTQVFLSYADEDRATMEKICNSLRRESITVWTNTTDIQTGEAFEEAIKRGIEQADNLVYLLSPDLVKSYFARKELEYALSLNKRIIPVLVRETSSESIPNALRDLQYIDLTDNVKEEDYHLDESQLLRILRQDEAYYNEHKVLLTKALKWKRQQQNPSILLRGYNLRSAQSWLKVANKRTQHPPTPLMEEFINESLQQPPAISLDVFISYSRADSDFARKLNDELQLQGKRTWFDQESIASGADFAEEIKQGINACDNFLFILSPRSVNSPYCAEEVEYAAQLNKRVVTVLHRLVNSDELHPELAKVQWIDFNQNERDFHANFRQLIRTLDTDREHLRSHTKWSQRAIEWKEKDKSDDLLLRGSELEIATNWLQEAQQNNKQPQATDLQKKFITASQEFRDHLLRQEEEQQKRELAQAQKLAAEQSRRAEVERQRAEEQTKAARSLRRLVVGLVVVFLGAAGAAVFAMIQTREAQRLRLSSIVQALAGQAPRQPEQLKQDERGALLARQAYLFNRRNQNQVLYQANVNDALRAVLGFRYFSTVLRDHTDRVWSVAFSSDGRTMASGSLDGTIRVWNLLQPGTKPIVLRGHENWVTSVAFSPDGQMLASGGDDQTVRLWDLRQPRAKPTIFNHKDRIWSVAFSPNGHTIASGSEDKTVSLWDLRQPSAKPIVLNGHKSIVRSLAFSSDGQRLASGSDDKTVRLWDLRQPSAKPTILTGHLEAVSSVAFSRDGHRLASGSQDKTVRLWNLRQPNSTPNTARLVKFNIGDPPKSPLKRGTYIPPFLRGARGDRSYPSSIDSTPIVLNGHNDIVRSVAFSSDGQMLASGSDDKTVRLWDLRQPSAKPTVLTGHLEAVSSVAFSRDSQRLASGSDDKTVRLWDLRQPSAAPTILRQKDSVSSVAFSSDSNTLASGSQSRYWKDHNVQLWNLRQPSAKPIVLTIPNSAGIYSVAFSPNGQMLASSAESMDKGKGGVQLWHLSQPGSKPTVLSKARGYSLAFSPDGHTLASAGYQKIQIWDLRQISNEPIVLRGHEKYVKSVAFSLDGNALASGGQDNTVRLWNLRQPNVKPIIWRGHEQPITSVAFRDGYTIASSSEDKTVRLWNLRQPNAASIILSGHEDKVRSVAFSRDGQTLASSSNDQTVRLWDLRQPNAAPTILRAVLRSATDGFSSVAFSSNGQSIALGSDDGTIRIWNVNTEALADKVCEKVWRNLTLEEWRRFVGKGIPYERTCPNLPADSEISNNTKPRSAPAQKLVTPAQMFPANKTIFNHYPRTATLRWSAVPGATSYTVEIEFCKSSRCTANNAPWILASNLQSTSYTFDFVGPQPGRWRVWAVDAAGRESPKSGWWEFEF